MKKVNLPKLGNAVGILSVLFFLLCMLWAFVVPADLKELHLNFLRMAFPGFSMSVAGVIVGIIEAFVYGWIFGAIISWFWNKYFV